MGSRFITIALGLLILVALFFNSYKGNVTPPCMNADEAAFSYNAYSLALTGADEYGVSWPLRLKSFGDYKMPLYSYLSIPFVGVYGLNETSARAVNIVLAILFPLIVYMLVTELFDRDEIGIVAGLLVAGSLGLNIIGRHTHEAYLSAFLTTLCVWLFVRVVINTNIASAVPFYITVALLLFSYHPGRIFAVFLLVAYVVLIVFTPEGMVSTQNTKAWFIGGFIALLVLFSITDILYSPDRIKNLLFFNDAGFSLKINELRGEGGSWLAYNKGTIAIKDITLRHLKYYSPQFLTIDGDGNTRFGFLGMAPMTVVEYVFFFIGLYFLYKNNERFRNFIIGVILIAPLSGSLSWADVSLSRSLFLFVPILIVSAYGFIWFLNAISPKAKIIALILILASQSFFLFYSWDFYFNHYPKRALAIRSWQCGYKEVAQIIKTDYKNVDKFYITKKNGEPYVFLLFYLQYPPGDYQKQASLTAPDEYGFGQVERFDKFEFNFNLPAEGKYIAVGYPDDFNDAPDEIKAQVKKIKVGTEEIFWVYDHR